MEHRQLSQLSISMAMGPIDIKGVISYIPKIVLWWYWTNNGVINMITRRVDVKARWSQCKQQLCGIPCILYQVPPNTTSISVYDELDRVALLAGSVMNLSRIWVAISFVNFFCVSWPRRLSFPYSRILPHWSPKIWHAEYVFIILCNKCLFY